ncbi:MAG TPA: hypothetical protein VII06_04225 [Chloroflexota bacterium]|jgi:hypothetical protein
MLGQTAFSAALFGLASALAQVPVDGTLSPTRTVADMVVQLNPVRPPNSCIRLDTGELDITLQALEGQPRGAIDYRFGGSGDLGDDSLTRITHPVTDEISILRVPVARGTYCYSLTYKTSLPRDTPLGEVVADSPRVRLQIIWVPPEPR